MRYLMFLLGLAVSVSHNVSSALGQAKSIPPANAFLQFAIQGMHCRGCAEGITGELLDTKGVVSADVSFTNKLAIVGIDTNQVTRSKLIQVISEAGYKAMTIPPTNNARIGAK